VLAAGIAVLVALGGVGLLRVTGHHSATAPANGAASPGQLTGISATTDKDVVIETDQGRLGFFRSTVATRLTYQLKLRCGRTG
jgi:hypothetical protein